MAIEHVIQRNNRIICMKHMIGSQCMNMVIQISITLPLHLPFRESLFSSFVTAKLDSYDLVVSKFGHSLFEQFPLEWVIVVKH